MQIVHIPFALVLDDFGFQNRRLQEFALVNHPLPVVLIAIRVNDEKLVRLLMRLHIVEQIYPIRRRDIRNQKHFTHPASSTSSSFGIASVSRDSIYQFMRPVNHKVNFFLSWTLISLPSCTSIIFSSVSAMTVWR